MSETDKFFEFLWFNAFNTYHFIGKINDRFEPIRAHVVSKLVDKITIIERCASDNLLFS